MAITIIIMPREDEPRPLSNYVPLAASAKTSGVEAARCFFADIPVQTATASFKIDSENGAVVLRWFDGGGKKRETSDFKNQTSNCPDHVQPSRFYVHYTQALTQYFTFTTRDLGVITLEDSYTVCQAPPTVFTDASGYQYVELYFHMAALNRSASKPPAALTSKLEAQLEKFTILCSPPPDDSPVLEAGLLRRMRRQWESMPTFYQEGLERVKKLLAAQLASQVRVIPSRKIPLKYNTACDAVQTIDRFELIGNHCYSALTPEVLANSPPSFFGRLLCLYHDLCKLCGDEEAVPLPPVLQVTWIRNPGTRAQTIPTSCFEATATRITSMSETTRATAEAERAIILALRYKQFIKRWKRPATVTPPMKEQNLRPDDVWAHFAQMIISKKPGPLHSTPVCEFELGALAAATARFNTVTNQKLKIPDAKANDDAIEAWLSWAAMPVCKDCRAIAYNFSGSSLYDFARYIRGKAQEKELPFLEKLPTLINGRLSDSYTDIPFINRQIDHPTINLYFLDTDFGLFEGNRIQVVVARDKTEDRDVQEWFRSRPGEEISDYVGFTWTEERHGSGEYTIINVDPWLPKVSPTRVASVKTAARPPSISIRKEFATAELAIRLAAEYYLSYYHPSTVHAQARNR
ncbi:hypothetical protein GGX14DRAFT_396404 [Mycena pura]|uniref:Uncharacterized protein n=1 Tax=Mycena pura TaxID=153505 RepID=A0AAD6YDQ4_9AGAR|nr:hypothetical protein GGX14DRAFT_396404 [Mycena pura]